MFIARIARPQSSPSSARLMGRRRPVLSPRLGLPACCKAEKVTEIAWGIALAVGRHEFAGVVADDIRAVVGRV